MDIKDINAIENLELRRMIQFNIDMGIIDFNGNNISGSPYDSVLRSVIHGMSSWQNSQWLRKSISKHCLVEALHFLYLKKEKTLNVSSCVA